MSTLRKGCQAWVHPSSALIQVGKNSDRFNGADEHYKPEHDQRERKNCGKGPTNTRPVLQIQFGHVSEEPDEEGPPSSMYVWKLHQATSKLDDRS